MKPRADGAIIHRGTHSISDSEVPHIMFIPMLAADIVGAARAWLQAHAADETVSRNLGPFVRRHAHGFTPVVAGTAVIT